MAYVIGGLGTVIKRKLDPSILVTYVQDFGDDYGLTDEELNLTQFEKDLRNIRGNCRDLYEYLDAIELRNEWKAWFKQTYPNKKYRKYIKKHSEELGIFIPIKPKYKPKRHERYQTWLLKTGNIPSRGTYELDIDGMNAAIDEWWENDAPRELGITRDEIPEVSDTVFDKKEHKEMERAVLNVLGAEEYNEKKDRKNRKKKNKGLYVVDQTDVEKEYDTILGITRTADDEDMYGSSKKKKNKKKKDSKTKFEFDWFWTDDNRLTFRLVEVKPKKKKKKVKGKYPTYNKEDKLSFDKDAPTFSEKGVILARVMDGRWEKELEKQEKQRESLKKWTAYGSSLMSTRDRELMAFYEELYQAGHNTRHLMELRDEDKDLRKQHKSEMKFYDSGVSTLGGFFNLVDSDDISNYEDFIGGIEEEFYKKEE